MPSKNFIVAIELGSTKITGVAGQKNHDGSFIVNAVVGKIPPPASARVWSIMQIRQCSV